MPLTLYTFLFLGGSAGGFFSGMLGIGGGIIMFPILLYLPPLLGFNTIEVKNITGLTMVQGFFASLTALLIYRKQRLVNKSLVLTLGPALFVSSLSGALLSKSLPDKYLLFIFGVLALLAAAAMLIPRSYLQDDSTEDTVHFKKSEAILIGVFIGFFLGLVGQGGAFIIIPVLLYLLKIPLRVALGSTLAIGLFSSTAGLVGKAATGQVPFLMTVALLAGAVPAASLGSILSRKTKVPLLRWLLAVLISVTAIKIWTSIF